MEAPKVKSTLQLPPVEYQDNARSKSRGSRQRNVGKTVKDKNIQETTMA